MGDEWESSVGNLMPFVPFWIAFDPENPGPTACIVGASLMKRMLMEGGRSEQDALAYIASMRRITEADWDKD